MLEMRSVPTKLLPTSIQHHSGVFIEKLQYPIVIVAQLVKQTAYNTKIMGLVWGGVTHTGRKVQYICTDTSTSWLWRKASSKCKCFRFRIGSGSYLDNVPNLVTLQC